MINEHRISLITRTMGRLHHLVQTLPSWLSLSSANSPAEPEGRGQAHNFIDDIVIVDWGCKEDLAPAWDLVGARRAVPSVTILNVPNETRWDAGASRNVGARWIESNKLQVASSKKEESDKSDGSDKSDFFLNIDCDCFLKPPILEAIEAAVSDPRSYCHINGADGHCWGSCLVAASAWRAVGGYREATIGNRGEDVDFYNRLRRAGYKRNAVFTAAMIAHLDHGNEERYPNSPVPDPRIEHRQFLRDMRQKMVPQRKRLAEVWQEGKMIGTEFI